MTVTLKQQIHKSDSANFNLYRRYSNLPTHSDVQFVEDSWKELKSGKINEKKWEKKLKEYLSRSHPQKIPEKWHTPEGITQAFIDNMPRLREVNYLHRLLSCHVWYDGDISDQDERILKSLFNWRAFSLIDRNVKLEYVRPCAGDPIRFEAYRGNGVVQGFLTEEFLLKKTRRGQGKRK